MRGLVLVLLVLVAAPLAAADHPGSNRGLARFEVPGLPLASPPGPTVHRPTDVDLAFAAWEAAWPERVDRLSVGTTSSGHDLMGIRVTDESVPADAAPLSTGKKLIVYLDGGHHGNEFLGVELVMYYLEDLLGKADAGDEATLRFLQESEVYALPILNVDGNLLDTRKNVRQVDVNRNYPFQWGGPGSGDRITDLNYRGPSAMSEDEVRANAEFGARLQPDLWITMHTGVAEFYWPWGYTLEPSPDDAFFSSLEKPFEEATNGRVDAMQSAELYEAAGATDDYGYGVVGSPTFTYEVHEDQFIPVYGQPISEIVKDQLAGLDFMVRNVRHMGAWLEPRVEAGALVLENEGWGVASNVTLRDGARVEAAPDVPPGERVVLDGWPATTEVSYRVLLIDTAHERTARAMDAVSRAAMDGPASVPGFGAALLGLALAVAMSLARRR